ncbi:MAG: nucleoid occlusion factor SlmA [Gammaproteobacteria bacterium]|jgi:TetR/AcrR family transcriptional regulator
MPRPSRKQQILETLADELERQQGKKITTAALASAAGVSEAALYRHFASKAKMFEALIEFAEESIFSRINQILEENKQAAARCYYITWLLLGFTERNPGITRLLLGDALTGENQRLHARVDQFFSRIESQFRQVLREAPMRGEELRTQEPELAARLLADWVEGRMHHFRRSGFRQTPMDGLEQSWTLLARSLFQEKPTGAATG